MTFFQTYSSILRYCHGQSAVVAQSVARRLGKAEVTGSSPANSFLRGTANAVPYFFEQDLFEYAFYGKMTP